VEILTSRQMRDIDRRAVRTFGIPEVVLMENAGLQLFAFLRRTFADLPARRLLLLCGGGNNGGDTLVLARHLRANSLPYNALLFAQGRDLGGSAGVNFGILRRQGAAPREVRRLSEWRAARRILAESDVVIDGILGTGLSRPVRGLLKRVFQDVNDADAEVVAVDIPSGLSGDTAAIPGPCVAADYTVTFARPKIPHLFPPAEGLCGDLHVADISIPREAVAEQNAGLELLEESDLVTFVPVRRSDSHKGTFGHALIVAGSRGKGGAARLAALGALRAGSGLVTAAIPASLQSGFVSRAMEVMTEALPETAEGSLGYGGLARILRLLSGKRVVAVGPGLTCNPETRKLVRDLVAKSRLPVILDADGINAFAGETDRLSGLRRPLILTPHPGEFGRLLGVDTRKVLEDRLSLAPAFARRHRCWLVLKGHRTLVASPAGGVYVNPTGNPGMATGGSGDALTGILAGLLAQGLEVEAALKLGVYLHGLAGDLAAAKTGQTPLLAREILASFPAAFARLRGRHDRAGI
jgi:ADP-dependent NAD(P)H-hydrate dehydratase / NAD(P)H-hydrate epimerase